MPLYKLMNNLDHTVSDIITTNKGHETNEDQTVSTSVTIHRPENWDEGCAVPTLIFKTIKGARDARAIVRMLTGNDAWEIYNLKGKKCP